MKPCITATLSGWILQKDLSGSCLIPFGLPTAGSKQCCWIGTITITGKNSTKNQAGFEAVSFDRIQLHHQKYLIVPFPSPQSLLQPYLYLLITPYSVIDRRQLKKHLF